MSNRESDVRVSEVRVSEVVDPQTDVVVVQQDHENLVAMNLGFAMSQKNELRPRTTTVQFTEPKTALGLAMEKRLQAAGFGL